MWARSLCIILALGVASRANDDKRPYRVISPTDFEAHRIAGTQQIAPDQETQRTIAADHKRRVVATLKLCLDRDGSFTSIGFLAPSDYPRWDEAILATIAKTWRFRPYEQDGKREAVCTAITEIYSARAADGAS